MSDQANLLELAFVATDLWEGIRHDLGLSLLGFDLEVLERLIEDIVQVD